MKRKSGQTVSERLSTAETRDRLTVQASAPAHPGPDWAIHILNLRARHVNWCEMESKHLQMRRSGKTVTANQTAKHSMQALHSRVSKPCPCHSPTSQDLHVGDLLVYHHQGYTYIGSPASLIRVVSGDQRDHHLRRCEYSGRHADISRLSWYRL